MNKLGLYYISRPHMQTGDVIEFRSRSVIGWLIRCVTGQDVNHSALLVDFKFPGDDSNRRYLLESVGGGVTLTLLSKRLREHRGHAWWLKLDRRYDHKRCDILTRAMEAYGTEYDYKGVLRQLFSRVSVDAARLFCSELIQWVLTRVGLIPELSTALRPGEFYRLCLYEERLKII